MIPRRVQKESLAAIYSQSGVRRRAIEKRAVRASKAVCSDMAGRAGF